MAGLNICKFYQLGHCKFGDCCRRNHVSEICGNKFCEPYKCSLRHPKSCKYFIQFGNCKFGEYCSYLHVPSKRNMLDNLKTETEGLKKQLSDVVK